MKTGIIDLFTSNTSDQCWITYLIIFFDDIHLKPGANFRNNIVTGFVSPYFQFIEWMFPNIFL